jgi:hypothetical protein
MANFQTHVTTSSVLGIGYAGAGLAIGLPIDTDTCLVAGGLCGISGMLPDVDSDGGVPLREVTTFMAAVVPMLLIDRFRELGLSHESMVLAGGALYLAVRFGAAELLKRYTVHRGMFHSIPAGMIFAELVFWISGADELARSYYKAGAVLLGFLSHLVLDELYSMYWHRGRLRLKKSFGTALKFWSESLWANFSTYAKLILLTGLILNDPSVKQKIGSPLRDNISRTAHELIESLVR